MEAMELATTIVWSLLAAGAVAALARRMFRDKGTGNDTSTTAKPLYRADHSILNLILPPPSMWMNMGFWKDTKDFPTACCALLEEVLKAAHIPHEHSVPRELKVTQKLLSILDLGFGCGDQSLYFQKYYCREKSTGAETTTTRSGWLDRYVGITLDPAQFRIAQGRLGLERPEYRDGRFKVHCADAADPTTWPQQLRDEIRKRCETRAEGGREERETWLLGLDAFYHFQPSRWPVIEYANREVGASLMAFDLCIAESPTFTQRMALRLFASFGQSPLANWGTIEEYRENLVKAGYSRERIEIRDVSDHVFGPLAEHLKRREEQAKQYGLSIGRYKYAGKMFAWWARTGMVRGCIIIARK